SDRHAHRRRPPHRDGPRRARACARELFVGRHRAPARGDLSRGNGMMTLRDGRWRILLVLPLLAGAVALIIWHGPDWHAVHRAFTLARWEWVVAAIGLN